MARIYIVQYEQGTYGDYRCFDIKAFVKKDNALKFAETKNKLVELFSNNISKIGRAHV